MTPRFFFLPANVSPVSRGNFLVMARSASVALGEVGQQSRFGIHVLLLENVSTFLLRLVLTLASLVSSVSSLSALIQLFSSNRFQASLVSFGYLAFCLLFLPLPCCYFSFSRVLFLFVCCLLRSWKWLISSIVSHPPICVLSYGCFSFACFFLVLLFFKGGFAHIQLRVERAVDWTSLFC